MMDKLNNLYFSIMFTREILHRYTLNKTGSTNWPILKLQTWTVSYIYFQLSLNILYKYMTHWTWNIEIYFIYINPLNHHEKEIVLILLWSIFQSHKEHTKITKNSLLIEDKWQTEQYNTDWSYLQLVSSPPP